MKILINLGEEHGERRKEALKKLAMEAGYEYQGKGSIGKLICALADGELGKELLTKKTWLMDIGEKVAALQPEWLQVIAMDDCYGAIQSAKNVMYYVAPEEPSQETEEEMTPNYDHEEDDDDDYYAEPPPLLEEEEEEEKLKPIYSEEEMEKATAAVNWPGELFRAKFDEVYGEGRGPLSK